MPVAEPVQMLTTCDACGMMVSAHTIITSRRDRDYGICLNCYNINIRTCNRCGIMGPRDFATTVTNAMGVSNYVTIIRTDDTDEPVCTDCGHRCENCDAFYEYEDSWAECCFEEVRYRNTGWVHDYSYHPVYLFQCINFTWGSRLS